MNISTLKGTGAHKTEVDICVLIQLQTQRCNWIDTHAHTHVSTQLSDISLSELVTMNDV